MKRNTVIMIFLLLLANIIVFDNGKSSTDYDTNKTIYTGDITVHENETLTSIGRGYNMAAWNSLSACGNITVEKNGTLYVKYSFLYYGTRYSIINNSFVYYPLTYRFDIWGTVILDRAMVLSGYAAWYPYKSLPQLQIVVHETGKLYADNTTFRGMGIKILKGNGEKRVFLNNCNFQGVTVPAALEIYGKNETAITNIRANVTGYHTNGTFLIMQKNSTLSIYFLDIYGEGKQYINPENGKRMNYFGGAKNTTLKNNTSLNLYDSEKLNYKKSDNTTINYYTTGEVALYDTFANPIDETFQINNKTYYTFKQFWIKTAIETDNTTEILHYELSIKKETYIYTPYYKPYFVVFENNVGAWIYDIKNSNIDPMHILFTLIGVYIVYSVMRPNKKRKSRR